MTSSLVPYVVGEPVPVRMGIVDMLRAFPIDGHVMSRSNFHRLERLGKFRRFELPSTIGAKAWSGAKVARYLGTEGGIAPIGPQRHRMQRRDTAKPDVQQHLGASRASESAAQGVGDLRVG